MICWCSSSLMFNLTGSNKPNKIKLLTQGFSSQLPPSSYESSSTCPFDIHPFNIPLLLAACWTSTIEDHLLCTNSVICLNLCYFKKFNISRNKSTTPLIVSVTVLKHNLVNTSMCEQKLNIPGIMKVDTLLDCIGLYRCIQLNVMWFSLTCVRHCDFKFSN